MPTGKQNKPRLFYHWHLSIVWIQTMRIFTRLHLADLEHLCCMRLCRVCLVKTVLLLSFLGQPCWNKSNCQVSPSPSLLHTSSLTITEKLCSGTGPCLLSQRQFLPMQEKSTLYRLIGETAATTATANVSYTVKSLGNVCAFGFCAGPFAKSESFDPTGRKITIQIHKLLMCNEARN